MTKSDYTQPIFISCLIGLLIIIFGTIYAVAQQVQRTDANYPQIQLAEDTAASLDAGSKPSQLISGQVDMHRSLAPFTIIYSHAGQPLAGNGYLDGSLPAVPMGVLQAAAGQTYHTVTWQPENDARIAAVTVAANNYYVLSGRSLHEVEKNENKTFWLSFAGGVASLLVVIIGYAISRRSIFLSKRT